MASVEGSSSGGAAIQYDYGTSDDKSSDSNNKAPRFNEILRLSLGGKPKCIVSLYDYMKSYEKFLKMALVMWP